MWKSNKYRRMIRIITFIFMLLVGCSLGCSHNVQENSVQTGQTDTSSKDQLAQLTRGMCDVNTMSIQGHHSQTMIDERPEQHRFNGSFKKKMLLFYYLCESLVALSTAWYVYILILRDKFINYLIAIIYIHKLDGEKALKYNLLNL